MDEANTARLVISIAVLTGVFALIGVALFVPTLNTEIQIVDMLIGGMVTAFAQIVSFYFKRSG